MNWKCDACKLFFENKPSFTTTCPMCNCGLTPVDGNTDNYQLWGSLKLNNRFCAICAHKFKTDEERVILEKPIQFDETLESQKAHKHCYDEMPEDERTQWHIKIKGG